MILKRLREETRVQHETVERKVDLVARTSTVADYAQLLGRFLGFYLPMERDVERLAAIDRVDLELEQRRKTLWLMQDLAALGSDARSIASLPVCTQLPVVDTVPQALGCLYVMEGSTLGGQVISRHIASKLGIQVENGGRFFTSYGPGVGTMWKKFGAIVTAESSSTEIEESIVRSACETFDAFGRWLAPESDSAGH